MRKRNDLRHQVITVFLLTLFAGFSLFGIFLVKGSLTHDQLNCFSLFKNNLYALNHFGEIAWWDPDVSKNGFPLYYFSILGDNFNSPLFAILCFFFWVLGLLKVSINSYQPLFVVYFGFVVPFLFSLSLLSLGRQIFRNSYVFFYIILLASFSPGVVFSTTDRMFEHSVYGLFLAAAWLRFLRVPGRKTFLVFGISFLVFTLSFSHMTLYWNAVFIPLFVLTTISIGQGRGFLKRIYDSVPAYYWLLLVASVAVCALPTLLALTHGSDIYRTASVLSPPDADILDNTKDGRIYPYDWIFSGNPVELLSVGTPGVGFRWSGSTYTLMHSDGGYIAYDYLGVLALPFTFLGLVFGRKPWRYRLLLMLLVSSCIILLSGYSPIFSTILAWPTSLRSVRHFSDTSFRAGVFYILILSAGLGFEVCTRWSGRRFWRPVFAFTFLASVILSFFLLSAVKGEWKDILNDTSVSVYCVIIFFTSVIAVSLMFAKRRTLLNSALVVLLLITFIDVSTGAFLHIRKINYIWGREPIKMADKRFGHPDSPHTVTDTLAVRNSISVSKRPYLKVIYPEEFMDNFDNTSYRSMWGNENGEWEQVTAGGDNFYRARLPNELSYSSVCIDGLEDFEVEFDAEFTYGGIFLRSSYSAGKMSGVLLAAGPDSIHWHFVENGDFGSQIGVTNVPGLAHRMATFKVVVMNETYAVYIDNSPLPVSVIEDGRFKGGRVALFSVRPGPKFYRVKLSNFAYGSIDDVKVIRQTFNTLDLEVNAKEESVLFWGDVYFPFWHAYVDGKKTEVIKMMNGAGKGVAVPVGHSTVKFRFSPGLLPYALAMAYTVLTAFCVLWIILYRKEKYLYNAG